MNESDDFMAIPRLVTLSTISLCLQKAREHFRPEIFSTKLSFSQQNEMSTLRTFLSSAAAVCEVRRKQDVRLSMKKKEKFAFIFQFDGNTLRPW